MVGQILAVDPPVASSLTPQTPAALDRTIRICLEKDADERFQSAHDLKLQLQMMAEASATPFPAKVMPRWVRVGWLAAAIVVLLAFAAAAYFGFSARQPQPTLRSSLLAPDNAGFFSEAGVPALSPDGTKLAFVGMGERGSYLLYVRPLDSSTAQPLAGTEGANFPFWSPDSQNLAFFVGNKLERISAAGGPVLQVVDVPGSESRGGSWGATGTILITSNIAPQTVRQVSAMGGTLTAASNLSAGDSLHPAEHSHWWPFFLPDGKHFLFWSQQGEEVCLGELGSLDHKVLISGSSDAIYANGYLLFARGGTLFAQRFSTRDLALNGAPIPIAENVVTYHTIGDHAVFSASQNGLLVYQGGQSAAGWPLVWYSREGKALGPLAKEGPHHAPAISPDGDEVALTRGQSDHPIGDVWVFDVRRGTQTRLTFDGRSAYPIWAPGGKKVIYASFSADQPDLKTAVRPDILKIKAADNSGPEQNLVPSTLNFAAFPSISTDGRHLVFQTNGDKTAWDVWGVDLHGDRKPFPLVQTPFIDLLPSISPDGKWVAYTSNETGRSEIFITAFAGDGAKWQVSTDGARESRWRGDGKELFFSAHDSSIMAVDVTTETNTVVLGTPHLLFRARMQSAPLGQFDVTRDGKKFLVNSVNAQGGSNPLTLLTNWTAELTK